MADSPSKSPTASRIHLTDVTAESGIDLRLTSGRTPSTQILEVKGGGIALIDHDRDGDLDVFVPNGATLDAPERGPGGRLFENLGGLRFRDATAAAGLELRRWSFGVAVGDYDGDGFDDLHVSCYGQNALLRNSGDGAFVDVTVAAGLGSSHWTTSSAFGDVDGDGDLDLYVTNYVDFDTRNPPPRASYMGASVLAGPRGLRPMPDVLYENRGDGTFDDITARSGCGRVTPAYGLNVAVLDLDADGRQDIFVANDSSANFLFVNRGGGRFENRGVQSGLAFNAAGAPQATMGIAIGDVDSNGLPDLFTTNFSSDTNTLHLNISSVSRKARDALFVDRTEPFGLGMVSWIYLGWACAFYDLDLDADEDLLVFNGHVYPEAASADLASPYEQPPLLFERRGDRFDRVPASEAGAWLSKGYRARSASFGDLDRDGDIDVVFTELNGPLRVLRNDATPPGGWLIVELRDERPASRNRRGIGSRIELSADGAGGRTQTRWIVGGGPFQSANAPYAHFGVPGNATNLSVKVTWPDGFVQTTRVEADRYVEVTRNE